MLSSSVRRQRWGLLLGTGLARLSLVNHHSQLRVPPRPWRWLIPFEAAGKSNFKKLGLELDLTAGGLGLHLTTDTDGGTPAYSLVGAQDDYIARLFERRFFVLGIRAGIAGAFFAFAIALLVTYGGPGQSDGFIPVWSFSLWDGAVLLLAPVLAGLIAALSARLAVANDLRARW